MSTNVSWRAGASWQGSESIMTVQRFIDTSEVIRRLAAFKESWLALVATGGESMGAATVDLDCLFDDLAQLLTLSEGEADAWLESL